MSKKQDLNGKITAASVAFKTIETDFELNPSSLPNQDHLLGHLKEITKIAHKATKKLIKSKKGGTPVTTHSLAAYQSLQHISAATIVLAEEAGLIERRKPKVTKL